MRKRKVFGRREVTFDGRTYRIEMRADRLAVRRKHSRRVLFWKLSDLVSITEGQLLLTLRGED